MFEERNERICNYLRRVLSNDKYDYALAHYLCFDSLSVCFPDLTLKEAVELIEKVEKELALA